MVKNNQSASAKEDPFRDEFHRLLGRLIHSIARFDFTVGLQLNWLGPHCQQDVSVLLSARQAKLGERLKKLKALIMDVYEPAGTQALAEFSTWFDKADQARGLRNDYAHGRWGVPGKYLFKPPGRLIDAKPLLAFIPLHWDMTPDRADDSVYMTLEEFATQVSDAESLFDAYWKLCKRYESQAKPHRSFEVFRESGLAGADTESSP
jgi:hypothetical protein